MRRRFNHTLLFVVAAFLMLRPPQAAAAESPHALGDILKKTESYYQQVQAYTAYFQQWTASSAASSMITEASGKLYYQKPRQMRWEYEAPEVQVFVANQQLAWLYVPSEKQISFFDAKTFFSSPLAQTFFDGISELRSHFEVSLDAKQSNATNAVLKLVPKKEDPNIELLYLWIDLETYQIVKVETQDALANTNRIELKSQQAVSATDSELFQLVIPPSTAVVDAEGKVLTPAEIQDLRRKLPPR